MAILNSRSMPATSDQNSNLKPLIRMVYEEQTDKYCQPDTRVSENKDTISQVEGYRVSQCSETTQENYPRCLILSLSTALVARILLPCIHICMAISVDWSPAMISIITHNSQANGLFWWPSWIFLRKKHVVLFRDMFTKIQDFISVVRLKNGHSSS